LHSQCVYYFHRLKRTTCRIFRIIDTPPAIPTSGGVWPASCTGRVTFQDIDFTYPTRTDVPVLSNFNLTVEPNQTVALVGSSGSGRFHFLMCKDL